MLLIFNFVWWQTILIFFCNKTFFDSLVFRSQLKKTDHAWNDKKKKKTSNCKYIEEKSNELKNKVTLPAPQFDFSRLSLSLAGQTKMSRVMNDNVKGDFFPTALA